MNYFDIFWMTMFNAAFCIILPRMVTFNWWEIAQNLSSKGVSREQKPDSVVVNS